MATPTGPTASDGRTRRRRWPVVSATRCGSQPRTGAGAAAPAGGGRERVRRPVLPRRRRPHPVLDHAPLAGLPPGQGADSSTVDPYTRAGRGGGQPVDDLADPRRVYELFEGGAVVLQSLHRFWPPLARFGRDLELALTHPRPGERLRHPARRPGAGAAPRHPRRVRAPGTGASAGRCATPTAGPASGCSGPSWPRATASTSPGGSRTRPGRPRPPRST